MCTDSAPAFRVAPIHHRRLGEDPPWSPVVEPTLTSMLDRKNIIFHRKKKHGFNSIFEKKIFQSGT